MELRLLGPVELIVDGGRVPIGGPRQRAVLADLALCAGRPVSVERLIDDIWGDDAPAAAGHTIEAYVSRLRGCLRRVGLSAAIERRGRGYQLRIDRDQVDALRAIDHLAAARHALEDGAPGRAVELARVAVRLRRGPALSDIREAPFTDAAADGLERAHVEAVGLVAAGALALGQNLDVIAELTRVIAEAPYHEPFYRQLMLALYREGRAVEALEVYRRASRTLRHDLGVEPGPDLRDLERDILNHSLGDRGRVTVPDHRTSPVQAFTPRPRMAARRWRSGVAAAIVVVAAGAIAVAFVEARSERRTSFAVTGVTEIDAHGALGRSVALPSEPGALTAGAGAVWASSPESHAVYRVDPKSSTAQVIPVGRGPGALAAGAADVWVANTLDSTVSRINAASATVVQTIPVGAQPAGIAVSRNTVWVADGAQRAVTILDATTGRVTATRPLALSPYGITVADGSAWVTNPDAADVTRIDPSGSPDVRIAVGDGPSAIMDAYDSVWVADTIAGRVVRIDPRTNRVVAAIVVGRDPVALVASGGAVWVADRLSSALIVIDPSTNRISRRMSLPGRPVALANWSARVWAGTRPGGSAPTGGTVRVEASTPPSSVDPALSFPQLPYQFFEGTYDSLLGYAQIGGSAGLQLVPNLAAALPTVSDAGLRYTFTLRSAIRYSDGSLVRPADFRRAIERAAQLNPTAASFLSAIAGVTVCQSAPSCDLRRGIATSDSRRTITFSLDHPDADFLYQMAMPFNAPVPATTPAHVSGGQPIPSTGPYHIERYRPGHEVDFARNPHFREWSSVAEPKGSPDHISWRFGASAQRELRDVETGSADWVADPVSDPADLVAQFPSQTHVNPTLSIDYAAFNTRVPPFNDVRVRRAFSLAADRARLVSELGGPSAASPTCQILPPGLPGYTGYCPFTVDPNVKGRWVGPDLATARRLVTESHTAGMSVVVWGQPFEAVTSRFMVEVLDELGYRASVVTPEPATYFAGVNDSRRKVQATDGEWTADYPSPGDFFDLFFRCSSFRLADPNATRDGAFFCDQRLDRLMDRADAQELTDPGAAATTWATVDRAVTGEAPWVPLVTTTWTDLLSRRIRNYQYNAAVGLLLDQLSVAR